MTPSNSGLRVSIPQAIYCAGGYIEGEVLLDFKQLQHENIEEVHIKLRGAVHTYVKGDRDNGREVRWIIHTNTSLWVHGSAYPPPGSDVLHLDFHFLLPSDLPPSFHYKSYGHSASVRYTLTAVGVRPGILKLNRRLSTPLVILPRDDLGVQLKAAMLNLGWKRFHHEEKIRKGLWGSYATVQLQLSLPDIPMLPLFVDIPYTIDVVTTTAPLTRSRADAHPMGRPIFPAPPNKLSQITLRMYRKLRVYAEYSCVDAVLEPVWSQGDWRDVERAEVDKAESSALEWMIVSEDNQKGGEEMGMWVQHARFRSKMHLSMPPTFVIDTIRCEYYLSLVVPFSGIGNDVKMLVPVAVSSGINAPLSCGQSSSVTTQPYTLDLPPAYWDVNDQEWSHFNSKD